MSLGARVIEVTRFAAISFSAIANVAAQGGDAGWERAARREIAAGLGILPGQG